MSENSKLNKRDFLKKAGLTTVGALGASTLATPYVRAQSPIKWRLQTYAGPALAEHVIKPSIDAFNKAANGEMVIELYGAYFPFASRYSLDVPALFNWYGLNEIWEEAYKEIPGVTWLSAGSWDPCNFVTTKPIRSVADLKGLRVFTFPTGGRFLTKFGVVPVTLPWEDIEVAIQTGELDGVAWCGATEAYTVGWADINKYYLTNNINGAWAGSYFANTEKWDAVPDHLKTLFKLAMDSSHYYRQHWYWWGEAHYRTTGGKLELTTIPESEWKQIEDAAEQFWDEIATKSERNAKVVAILKKYQETMRGAGAPYRYA